MLALAIFYRSFLTSTPIDIPDDVLPLLSRNWGLIFSDTEPWYTLVVNLLFFYDGAFFGISVNVLLARPVPLEDLEQASCGQIDFN